jgi:hypothetical protein
VVIRHHFDSRQATLRRDGRTGYEAALLPALRRVDGVRLILGEGRTRAEVYGIGHRLPAAISIPLGLAAQLVEAGAPLEVRPAPRIDVA